MGESLEMGGYAAYVWPAYGVSAFAMLALALRIVLRGRALRRRIAQLEKAAPAPDETA